MAVSLLGILQTLGSKHFDTICIALLVSGITDKYMNQKSSDAICSIGNSYIGAISMIYSHF